MRKITGIIVSLLVGCTCAIMLASCGEVEIKRAKLVNNITITEGTELVLDDIRAKIEFADNTSTTVGISELTVDTTGFDNTKKGEDQTITITYKDFSFNVKVKVIEKEIEKIDVKEGSIPNTLVQGLDLDLSQAELIVTYNNGETQSITSGITTDYEDNFHNNELGEQTIVVSSSLGSASYKVTVVEPKVTSIAVQSGYNASLEQGETYSIGNLSIIANFENGTTKTISLGEAGLTVDKSGVNTQIPGEYTLKIAYKNTETTAKVTVKKKVLVDNIVVLNNSIPSSIFVGNDFNINNLSVKAIYDNQTTKTFSYGDAGLTVDLNGFNKNVANTYTIQITIQNKTIDFPVQVKVPQVVSAEITSGFVSEIIENAELDFSNIRIKVTKDNGEVIENLSESDIKTKNTTGFDNTKAGIYTIHLILSDSYDNYDLPVVITVGEPSITGYHIKAGTISSTLLEGTSIDITSAILVVEYDNETTSELTDGFTIDATGFNSNALAIQSINIKINNNTVCTYQIEVIAKSVSKVEYTSENSTLKTTVYEGETLDLTGVKADITYNNGTSETITLGQSAIDTTHFSSEIPTTDNTNYIVLSYGSIDSNNIVINVIERNDVTNITINNNSLKNVCFKGNNIDLTNLEVTVTFEDSTQRTAKYNVDNKLTVDLNGFDKDSLTTQTIKIKYKEYSFIGAYVKDFDITVKNPEVSTITKVSGVPASIEQGDTLDLSNFTVHIKYDNGNEFDASFGNDNKLSYDLNGFNSNIISNSQAIKVSYDSKTVEFIIEVVARQYENVVTYFSCELANDFAANKSVQSNKNEEFINRDNDLVVGIQNSVDLRIVANKLVETTPVSLKMSEINVSYKIEMYDDQNSEYVELTTNISEYVSINVVDHTLKFTNEAKDKKFKITATALNMKNGFTDNQFVVEFKVIDGYNVYNAQQLSIMDNTTDGRWNSLKESWNLSNIDTKNLIIMNSITIQDKDVPASHFYTHDELYDGNRLKEIFDSPVTGGARVGSMKDTHTAIYTRLLGDNDTFNIYGNYFDIKAQGLTKGVYSMDTSNGKYWYVSNEADAKSYVCMHQTLFRFQGERTADNQYGTTDIFRYASQGKATIQNAYFLGNGCRSDTPSDSGSIILCKANSVNLDIVNTIQKDFFIGWFGEGGYNFTGASVAQNATAQQLYISQEGNPQLNAKVRVIDSKGYNNYNCLFYMWGAANFYIEGGEFIGAGGPVVIADHVSSGFMEHEPSGTDTTYWVGGSPTNINVVNCKLESMVVGSEPWFITFGDAVTEAVTQISATDGGFNAIQCSRSILKANSNNVQQMNMIAILKFGAKEMPTGAGYSRSTMRVFKNIDDYNAYYTTGKLADGSTYYYGYDRSVDWTASGPGALAQIPGYYKAGLGAATCMENMIGGSDKGAPIFEGSLTGTSAVINQAAFEACATDLSKALTLHNTLAGDYVNLYLPNGFGAMLQCFDRPAK